MSIHRQRPSIAQRGSDTDIERIQKSHGEDGFTLVELMVVVLIIAILIAIGFPTFLGLRARADDRAAMSDLRNGFTAVKAYYTDVGSYAGFNAFAGGTIEPALTWVDTSTPGLGETGVDGVTDTTVVLNRVSASGAAFCLTDDTSAAGGIARGEGNADSWAACEALPDWRPG